MGFHEGEDVRTAIATCLLEHLLEYHFDTISPKAESAARSNALFGKTAAQCWKFGQAKERGRAQRFDRLLSDLRYVDD